MFLLIINWLKDVFFNSEPKFNHIFSKTKLYPDSSPSSFNLGLDLIVTTLLAKTFRLFFDNQHTFVRAVLSFPFLLPYIPGTTMERKLP